MTLSDLGTPGMCARQQGQLSPASISRQQACLKVMGTRLCVRLEQILYNVNVRILVCWLPRWLSGKDSACQEIWVPSLGREDPWRRAWLPTLVLLPGESQGQRSLVGYSPQGHTESDTTEVTEQQQL